MPLSDQQLQEMVRQAQAGNMSKQGQAMPGVPIPMPGAQQNQIPGGPQQIAAGATNIGDSGAQQEAMLQRLMQSQGQQQPQGFASGGRVPAQNPAGEPIDLSGGGGDPFAGPAYDYDAQKWHESGTPEARGLVRSQSQQDYNHHAGMDPKELRDYIGGQTKWRSGETLDGNMATQKAWMQKMAPYFDIRSSEPPPVPTGKFGPGFANGGYVAPQDSDIFQNSSRALVRAAMGHSRDGGDNEEDGLTGDELENLTRGGSMQGEKMPGYAKGGNVDEDMFARVHDALNRSDVRPYYQNYGISPDDIVDKTLWGSNDTLGNLRAKQDGATPQLSHPKDPAYCGGGKVAYSDGGTTEMAATEDKQDDRVGRMAKNHFMRKLAGFDDGGQTDFRGGGMIPGEAPFPGDNQMNDIVKASLGPGEGEIRMSPGEEVIPRSIMGKTNAPKLAAAKVRKDMMKKSPKMLA